MRGRSIATRVAGTALVALALACGDHEVAEATWSRLELAPPASTRPAVPATRQLAPASGVASKTSSGAERITFAGNFDLESFNRVRLRVSTQRRVRLTCTFELAEQVLATSTAWELPAGAVQTTAHLDLPLTPYSGKRADRLVIAAEGYGPGVELSGVELLAEPLTAWLPTSETELAALDLFGGDRRRGVGLTNRRPLEARLRAAPGAELRFSVGVPEALRVAGVPLAVAVVLTPRGGAPQTVRVDAGGGAWEDVRIPLRSFAGKQVTALFRLDSGPEQRELGCVIANARVCPAGGAAPAVLLVTSDANRADHSSSAGGAVSTPSLDRLAARGLSFDDCFTASNITNAAHIALMTGESPRDTRVVGNYTLLPEEALTLAERFRERGFMTLAAVGARHLAGCGLEQGFDRVSGPLDERRSAADTIDALDPWLVESEGTPVFVWLHLYDAHMPYTPPADMERLYYPSDRDPFDPALPAPQIPERYAVNMRPGVRDLEFMRGLYKSEITYVDRELARVLDHPRLGDAIVAFTADHGEALGEHDVYWDHDALYPEELRVPLILAWPGAPSGQRERRPVSLLDLGGLLLDVSEHPAQPHFTGPPPPRFALGTHAAMAAMTHAGWHAILWLGTDEKQHTLELYDLQRDPGCTEDRAAAESARAKEMRRALIDWLLAARPLQPPSRESEAAQQLARQIFGMVQERPQGRWFDPGCKCPACVAAE